MKRRIERAEARRQKAVEAYSLEKDLPAVQITDSGIVQEFEDSAWELPWEKAVILVGLENGLVDETGRTVSRRAAVLLKKAKIAHTRRRREYLQEQRLYASWSQES